MGARTAWLNAILRVLAGIRNGRSAASRLTRAPAGRTLLGRATQRVGRMDVRTALLTVAFVVAVLLLPGPANAATCSQHPNQAAAQAAADTVDADGDGIYCVISPH